MPDLYPLFFKPTLKHYLWGGRNLEKLGRNLPEGKQVAESWEIASHADGMTLIRNGHYAGKTLPELLGILGTDLVGYRYQSDLERGIFPLMVKLLDAEQRLSVQVHPDDAYARVHEGQNELGKAEMWVILSAKPGAGIVYGFSKETTPESLRQAIGSGMIDPLMNFIPVQAGDHICVPPGTLHAILEGVLLVEIQQNSNTTYRVYDWNRTDDQGIPRALHVDQALDVINFQQVTEKLPPTKILEVTPRFTREQLCHHVYFTTERIRFKRDGIFAGRCDGSTLEIWGVINGRAEIEGEYVDAVEFCLLPAGLGDFAIQAHKNSVLLRVFSA
jgi:mannose-6-phosphate isomerase